MRELRKQIESQRDLIISCMTLRKAIGILGIGLPFVLALGWRVFWRGEIQPSISAYYHTAMGDVFVGILFVIGFFLMSYRGHEPIDNLMGDLACLFAVGVALFPTTPVDAPGGTDTFGYLHLISAFLFFTVLIFFSLVLFRKTKHEEDKNLRTPEKKLRDRFYLACGMLMGLCIVLIGVYKIFLASKYAGLARLNPVFWLEATAIIAFGVSWFVKGEGILADVEKSAETRGES